MRQFHKLQPVAITNACQTRYATSNHSGFFNDDANRAGRELPIDAALGCELEPRLDAGEMEPEADDPDPPSDELPPAVRPRPDVFKPERPPPRQDEDEEEEEESDEPRRECSGACGGSSFCTAGGGGGDQNNPGGGGDSPPLTVFGCMGTTGSPGVLDTGGTSGSGTAGNSTGGGGGGLYGGGGGGVGCNLSGGGGGGGSDLVPAGGSVTTSYASRRSPFRGPTIRISP